MSNLNRTGGPNTPGGRARVSQNDAFEERAAIMEFDGGLAREDAEARAAPRRSQAPMNTVTVLEASNG